MFKIVFFNHYHRGDIFTNRGYVVAITESLRNFEFGYLHFNHPKLTRDISIKHEGQPLNFGGLQKIHEKIWWVEHECNARTVGDYLCGN